MKAKFAKFSDANTTSQNMKMNPVIILTELLVLIMEIYGSGSGSRKCTSKNWEKSTKFERKYKNWQWKVEEIREMKGVALNPYLIFSSALSCSSFGLGLACLSGLVGFALNHSFKWASSGPGPILANLEPLISG